MSIQYKSIKLLSKILYGTNKGTEVLREKWDYLIILDACRYDTFLNVISRFPVYGEAKYKFSKGSSTPEFIMENFYYREAPNIIYVNTNPMVDHVLREKKHKIFYKFISIWTYAWNHELETVTPKATYYYALKTFIKYPYKRIIVHFLQPHFPFIGKEYEYINSIVRRSMKHARRLALKNNHSSKQLLLQKLKLLTTMIILKRVIATEAELYLNKEIEVKDIIKAYTDNLYQALKYVIRLIKILPGKVVVTADHGEAFGEYLHTLIPIRVYGHPTGIHILPLIKVPWFTVDNRHKSIHDALRKAYREVIRLKLLENVRDSFSRPRYNNS